MLRLWGMSIRRNFRSLDMVSLIPVRFFQERSSICPNFGGIETGLRKKADSFCAAPMSEKIAIFLEEYSTLEEACAKIDEFISTLR